MCHSVEVSGLFTAEGSRQLINYPDADAALPIHDPQRGVVWIPWGRRSQEHGELPATGWLQGEGVLPEGWDRFNPASVLARVERFMEMTHDGEPRWFDMEDGKLLQCVLLRHGHEQRVYVVTTESPDEQHRSWPLTRGHRGKGRLAALV
ncbi:hypothetical protein DM872_11365 [Pseudomonas taiwanensis]|uniref:hypothetical protein n=1 Tax=Pseudomonas taiwanensis TaxID=470150 RepID=UPI0015BDA4D2|nr:hypothetical protein [Pseudomonas taiwanensis]NWL77450.1 hypothetical protein [Pseudomonas taiwanensis]